MRHQGIQKAFTLREGLFHLGRATRALFLVGRPWRRFWWVAPGAGSGGSPLAPGGCKRRGGVQRPSWIVRGGPKVEKIRGKNTRKKIPTDGDFPWTGRQRRLGAASTWAPYRFKGAGLKHRPLLSRTALTHGLEYAMIAHRSPRAARPRTCGANAWGCRLPSPECGIHHRIAPELPAAGPWRDGLFQQRPPLRQTPARHPCATP